MSTNLSGSFRSVGDLWRPKSTKVGVHPSVTADRKIKRLQMQSVKLKQIKDAKPETTYLEKLKAFVRAQDRLALLIGVLLLCILMFFFVGADFHLIGSPAESPYRSTEVRIYAACAMSVTIPLAIDAILDFIFCPTAGYIGLRFLSILSLIIYSCITISTTQYAHFLQIHLVFNYAQIFFQVSIILWLLYDLDRRHTWSFLRVALILGFWFSAIIVYFVQYMYQLVDWEVLTALRDFLNFATCVPFVAYSFLWLMDFRRYAVIYLPIHLSPYALPCNHSLLSSIM